MSYKEGFNPTEEDGSFRLPAKTNEEILDILSEMRQDWLSMIIAFTSNVSSANDILHEVYLRLDRLDKLKKCINVYEDGTTSVNKSYMYLTLRSVSYDYVKAKEKVKESNSIDAFGLDVEDVSEDYVEQNEDLGRLVDRMNSVVENCHWFDKQVFYLYNDSNSYMAKLSEEIGISKSTIDQAIQRVKRAIRLELRDEYIAYRRKNTKHKNIEKWVKK